MKLKFVFLFSVIYNTVWANADTGCSITSYAQIVKVNNIIDDSIIKKSNCSDETNKHFINLVQNASGKLNTTYFKHYFSQELNTTVQIEPTQVFVSSIKNIIENQYKNFIIKKVDSLFGQGSFNLEKQQNIKLSCSQCNSTGEKNIKVMFGSKTYWINASLLKPVEVLKLQANLNPILPILQKEDFKREVVPSKTHHKYFTDLKNIQYYRLNRPLSKGAILKVSDLRPKMLIKYGQKVKIYLKSKTVQIRSTAIARKSGKFGDFIELINPKTKKTMLGKITGFNKAMVEL